MVVSPVPSWSSSSSSLSRPPSPGALLAGGDSVFEQCTVYADDPYESEFASYLAQVRGVAVFDEFGRLDREASDVLVQPPPATPAAAVLASMAAAVANTASSAATTAAASGLLFSSSSSNSSSGGGGNYLGGGCGGAVGFARPATYPAPLRVPLSQSGLVWSQPVLVPQMNAAAGAYYSACCDGSGACTAPTPTYSGGGGGGGGGPAVGVSRQQSQSALAAAAAARAAPPWV